MSDVDGKDLMFDWNQRGDVPPPRLRKVELFDETLRDGIQCPSVTDPPIDDKLAIVRGLSALGVHMMDIGLPGAGPRAVEDVTAIVSMVRDEKLPVKLAVAGRTHPADIAPCIAIAEKTGVPIELYLFLGTSPVRLYAEGWTVDLLEERTRAAVRMTKDAGLPLTFVTEDTIRSQPTVLRRLFEAAVDEGTDAICLCDTVGHATPEGTKNLVQFTRAILRGMGATTRIDWHGHNDRGYGVVNTLAAIEAGADRVHGTILGIGERVGNTPLDQLMVNLKLAGVDIGDLSGLGDVVDRVARSCRVDIPVSYPVFGRDAFRTGTGVHAAAVIKAERKGDTALADTIYSGVPAGWFGRSQVIEVGHMAGDSNIVYWLRKRNIEPRDDLVAKIRSAAKASNRVLEEDELLALVHA